MKEIRKIFRSEPPRQKSSYFIMPFSETLAIRGTEAPPGLIIPSGLPPRVRYELPDEPIIE